jgi:hypothetical protein
MRLEAVDEPHRTTCCPCNKNKNKTVLDALNPDMSSESLFSAPDGPHKNLAQNQCFIDCTQIFLDADNSLRRREREKERS